MLQDDALSDLALMYRLLGRVRGGHDLLRQHVAEYVEAVGKELVTADANATEGKDEGKEEGKEGKEGKETKGKTSREIYSDFIQALLTLKNRMDVIVSECFGADKLFVKDVSRAFEKFVNLNDRTPQYLSLFVDDQLTRGMKGMTDEEMERTLNSVIAVFRFLSDKDVFEKYYKQHLSKRLLSNTSVSEDGERQMIAKLKMECGFQFTSKLEGMFQDIHLNTDANREFETWLSNSGQELPLQLQVTVLTTTYWPISRSTLDGTARLPSQLTKCTETFTKFYLSKHDGRKLTFQPGLGDLELRAVVGKTSRSITCSVYQGILLLLFTEPESLTYTELLQQSGISESDMKRHLLAMTSSSKKDFRVLYKTGDKKTLAPQDVFTVNGAWKPKLKHVKLGLLGSAKARDKEAEETNKKVNRKRRYRKEGVLSGFFFLLFD